MDSLALRDALTRLARKHTWTWNPGLRRVFASLDSDRLDRHPAAIVADTGNERLDALLSDADLMDVVTAEVEAIDAIEHTVRFDQAVSRLNGKPVRLEFTLSNARLFSFSVR